MTRRELTTWLRGSELTVRNDVLTSVGAPTVTDDVLSRGHKWRGLGAIVVHGAPLVTGAFLKAYAGARLKRLHLYDVPLGDEACRWIAALEHLESLVLRGAPVGERGARALAGCRRLKRLELTTTVPWVDPDLPRVFEGHGSLTHVSLEGPGLAMASRMIAGCTLTIAAT